MNLRLTRNHKNIIFASVLLLPAFALLALTIISPLIKSVLMSFTDYSLLSSDRNWNNFANYGEILRSSEFYHSLRVTLKYVVITVLFDLILGMALAVVLNQKIRFRGFFRSIIMIPWAIPTIVTALIFMWIYQGDYGVLNYTLTHLGIIDANINWLRTTSTALSAIIVVAIFRQIPLVTVMLLAGLQGISGSLYEAARIDGASNWKVFMNITLPMLKPVISSVSLIIIVNNFQMFTLFFTLTNGGPAGSTTSLAIFTYLTAFSKYEMGKASAIGVVWLVLLFAFSMIFTRLMNREDR